MSTLRPTLHETQTHLDLKWCYLSSMLMMTTQCGSRVTATWSNEVEKQHLSPWSDLLKVQIRSRADMLPPSLGPAKCPVRIAKLKHFYSLDIMEVIHGHVGWWSSTVMMNRNIRCLLYKLVKNQNWVCGCRARTNH